MTTTVMTPHTAGRALAVAEAIADRVATPPLAAQWIRPAHQTSSGPLSLGRGAAGIALLHIERARTGLTDWATAHRWLAHITAGGISTAPGNGLYDGPPAVAYALHLAATVRPGSYQRALATLDTHISTSLRDTVAAVHARIERGDLPRLAEWDLISGITGTTRYLLDRDPTQPAVQQALQCLVRITEPIIHNGQPLPGWWTHLDPASRPNPDFNGGHANLGLAHGITGPLALLATAAQHGITVPHHTEAIQRICHWLDTWQQTSPTGPWWPQWIHRTEHHTHHLDNQPPPRPSWCYGAAGQAHTHHLAGRTLRDQSRIQLARDALYAAANEDSPAQLDEPNLCHGLAGLIHTIRHTAADHPTSDQDTYAPHLLTRLLDTLPPEPERAAETLLAAGGPEFLEGAVGVALTLLSAVIDPTLEGRWDTCLLLR